MKYGKELGDAIQQAITLKIVTGKAKSKKEIAEHFGVKPPSLYDWMASGCISKKHLNTLRDYFSDVVDDNFWEVSTTENSNILNAIVLMYEELSIREKQELLKRIL